MTEHTRRRFREDSPNDSILATVRSTSAILFGVIRMLAHRDVSPVPESLPVMQAYHARLVSWNHLLFILVQMVKRFVAVHAEDIHVLRSLSDIPVLRFVPLVRSCQTKDIRICGVDCEVITPVTASQKPSIICLYIHGGGFALCNPTTHRIVTQGIVSMMAAEEFGVHVTLVAPHYRRIPEYSIEDALDDCMAVYRELGVMFASSGIYVAGDSAGGAMSVLLVDRLVKMSHGSALPIGVCLLSPWCEWETQSAASTHDYIGTSVLSTMSRLIRESSPDTRSPMKLELTMKSFPKVLIQAGSHETLLTQILEFHTHCETSNIPVVFETYQDMVHVPHFFHFFHPEAKRAMHDLCRFMSNVK